MRVARLPLAASKSATDPSAPPVATSLASFGLTRIAWMPFALVAWHGALDPTLMDAIASGVARSAEISRFFRPLLSSLLLEVIASTAPGGMPPRAFFPSPPSTSIASDASFERLPPGAAAGPAALAFVSASRASSRSLMSLEMTRHAASCW